MIADDGIGVNAGVWPVDLRRRQARVRLSIRLEILLNRISCDYLTVQPAAITLRINENAKYCGPDSVMSWQILNRNDRFCIVIDFVKS